MTGSHRTQKNTIFERFQLNLPKTTFFQSCDFILIFFYFKKNAPEYIDPSGHFETQYVKAKNGGDIKLF